MENVVKSAKAGDKLRRLRTQLGITARELEELSRQIASQQNNDEFVISHGRIIQVENDESTPSIYKLCSMSAIYGVPLNELVGMFVNLGQLTRYTRELKREQCRLLRFETEQPNKVMTFPIKFDPGFTMDRTNLLSRMVQVWGEVPVPLIQDLKLRSMVYGVIGLSDFTMYPLLKPGSIVQIDDRQRKVVPAQPGNEYNRAIYFIELRDAYLCGWCEIQKNRLFIIPHPLSPCKVRVFDHPSEAEVVGRVVAVAARISLQNPGAPATAGASPPEESAAPPGD